MAVSIRHALAQGSVVAALGRAAWAGARRKAAGDASLPGPWIQATLPPRPEALVRDYVRHVGGDPAWYRGRVPAHLFPQWGFPLAARALAALPYPLARVINAGCRIEQHGPLVAGEPLVVRARVERVDDDGLRAVVTTRIVTGHRGSAERVVAELRAFIPLQRDGASKKERARATVPADAREIAFSTIGERAGLDFAKLTGDFNPIHWLPVYARAAGFRACILHGFSTLARAIEALDRARLTGDPMRLACVDARFTRPLVLPARAGVYVTNDGGLWLGDAPGGGAYLDARFTTTMETRS